MKTSRVFLLQKLFLVANYNVDDDYICSTLGSWCIYIVCREKHINMYFILFGTRLIAYSALGLIICHAYQ